MASIIIWFTISLALVCNICEADSVDILSSKMSEDRSSLASGGGIDFRLLARIIVGQSEKTARRALTTAKYLPNAQNAQKVVCTKNLSEAIGYIVNLRELLGPGSVIDAVKKIDIQKRVFSAITCIYTCEAAYNANGPPPQLKKDTKEAINLVYQVYRISFRL
ncbi:hypothetical protein ABFS83_03G039400 [Erythranthe nasuta]